MSAETSEIHCPATHPETGGELWHYEWNGWMWCGREGEAFDWPEENTACPYCNQHVEVGV